MFDASSFLGGGSFLCSAVTNAVELGAAASKSYTELIIKDCHSSSGLYRRGRGVAGAGLEMP